jgi:hypothetical protein
VGCIHMMAFRIDGLKEHAERMVGDLELKNAMHR